jgi:hypothetical protein
MRARALGVGDKRKIWTSDVSFKRRIHAANDRSLWLMEPLRSLFSQLQTINCDLSFFFQLSLQPDISAQRALRTARYGIYKHN